LQLSWVVPIISGGKKSLSVSRENQSAYEFGFQGSGGKDL
jgi:hypothetical protein